MTAAPLPDELSTVAPGDHDAAPRAPKDEPTGLRLVRASTGRLRLGQGRLWWLAVAWLTLVVGSAVLADLLPLRAYDDLVTTLRPRTAIGARLPEPLGTDVLGRSVLSRLVYGARQSLAIGVLSAAVSATVGTVVGVTMGYVRGRVDALLGLVLDALLAFPALVLLMAIASIGRRDTATVVVSLSILGFPIFARLVRGQTLALADREFVMAARVLGATQRRIIFREILPNVLPLTLALVLLVVAVFVTAEGALSFVGLGVPPPHPSWGGMIDEGRPDLQGSPHLIFLPSGCLVLTVLSLRIVGERLQARVDPGRDAST